MVSETPRNTLSLNLIQHDSKPTNSVFTQIQHDTSNNVTNQAEKTSTFYCYTEFALRYEHRKTLF